MNRIVIKFDDNGEIDVIACDQECRIFFYDEKCISEPLYELTTGLTKVVGVHEVRNIIGDTPAATIDSDGPWKKTNPVLYAYRDFTNYEVGKLKEPWIIIICLLIAVIPFLSATIYFFKNPYILWIILGGFIVNIFWAIFCATKLHEILSNWGKR